VFFVNKSKSKNQRNKRYYREKNQTNLAKKYTLNTEKLENICGKFNSLLGGKLLTTINETNPLESRQRIENIKFLIKFTFHPKLAI
jgi:hypothetical protein